MNETGKWRTLEQERAVFALERVQQLKELGDKAKEAAMYIRKLPAMTFSNGLGQALAFLFAKAEGNIEHPAGRVYGILAAWLIERRKIYSGNWDELLETMMKTNRDKYQLAQEEIWALLDWLKKFTDAFLPKEEPEAAIEKGE